MSEIFLLDTFVSHLCLRPQILKDAGNTTFIVKVNFNNFPSISIRPNTSSPKILADCSSDFLFYKGAIRYFSMAVKRLAKLMKENPLKIGVFREGDSFPMCQVIIPLFGCACGLVSDTCEEHYPQVFTIDGPFDLLDLGKSISGRIYINVAFINYGRFVDSQFSLLNQSFVFKNSSQDSEFECFRISVPEHCSEDVKINPRTLEKIPDIKWSSFFQEGIENFIKYLIVILPSSKHLLVVKPPTKTPHIYSKEQELPEVKKKKGVKKGKKK